MIPRIIHQIHLGGEKTMGKDVAGWIRSVGKYHPDWSRIIWNEDMLRGIEINTGYLSREYGNWACVTNIIRLRLLDLFGGIYIDTDFEALDTLDRLPIENYEAFAAFQDGGRICNAIMGSEKGSPWIKWQREHFEDFDPKDGASGVYVATAAPREGLTIIPTHLVYPWLYDSPPETRIPHADSILVHHWKGSWVRT